MIVNAQFCIYNPVTQERTPLQVSQSWQCLTQEPHSLNADQLFSLLISSESSVELSVTEDADAGFSEKVREATSDYLASLISEKVGGDSVASALWSASQAFPPVEMAPVLDDINDLVDKAVSGQIDTIVSTAGLTSEAAEAVSGITANIILAPIEKPVREVTVTIELIGLAVGFLIMQPHLVAVCANALLHETSKEIVSKAIDRILVEALSPSKASVDIPTTKAVETAEKLRAALALAGFPTGDPTETPASVHGILGEPTDEHSPTEVGPAIDPAIESPYNGHSAY